jgi:ribonuclease HII
MSKAERINAAFAHDCGLWGKGLVFAGIDEAGRGPLAGCVTVACVVLPESPRIPFVYDSKQVSAKKRGELYDLITSTAVFWQVGRAEAREIDAINILQATKLAMRRAAKGAPAGMFLIDAVKGVGLPGEELAIIKGDAVSYSIAAASIIAKVSRDREMLELDILYPAYGFRRNKGYGTREHMEALKAWGPCPVHRASFIRGILSL